MSRVEAVQFQPERWTLEVTFDSIEEQKKSIMWNGVDEAFSFAKHAADQSGALWEEVREMIKWPKGSRTVTVTADILDYLANLQQWVTFHSIPKRVELVRNVEGRGE